MVVLIWGAFRSFPFFSFPEKKLQWVKWKEEAVLRKMTLRLSWSEAWDLEKNSYLEDESSWYYHQEQLVLLPLVAKQVFSNAYYKSTVWRSGIVCRETSLSLFCSCWWLRKLFRRIQKDFFDDFYWALHFPPIFSLAEQNSPRQRVRANSPLVQMVLIN